MKLVYRYHIMWVYLVICTMLGCGKNVTGPEQLNQAGFPLKVGNRWQYTVTSKSEVSSQGVVTFTDSTTVNVVWLIEAEEEVFGMDTFRLHVTAEHKGGRADGIVASQDQWFAMVGDTLRSVAIKGNGNIEPVIAGLFKRVAPHQDGLGDLGVLNLPGIAQDSIFPSGLNILVFPLEKGKSWNHGGPAFLRSFFSVNVKVVGPVEPVTVPAGTFESWPVTRIAATSEFDDIMRQWFGSSGLIRTEREISGLINIVDENGNLIHNGGVAITRETLVLESVTLQ